MNGVTAAEQYIKSLPASYLSMDTSGRVLRMDSASKILAPGLRCGWVAGSAQIIEKFVQYSGVGVLSPSGPSQVMVYKLVDETWGHEGFFGWLRSLSAHYRRRRDCLVEARRRYLPSDICQCKVPTEGMFVWMNIGISDLSGPHEVGSGSSYPDIEDRIYKRAHENGVLVSKGSWFISDVEEKDGIHFRLTFATAPSMDLPGAVQMFAAAVQSELLPHQSRHQES